MKVDWRLKSKQTVNSSDEFGEEKNQSVSEEKDLEYLVPHPLLPQLPKRRTVFHVFGQAWLDATEK